MCLLKYFVTVGEDISLTKLGIPPLLDLNDPIQSSDRQAPEISGLRHVDLHTHIFDASTLRAWERRPVKRMLGVHDLHQIGGQEVS